PAGPSLPPAPRLGEKRLTRRNGSVIRAAGQRAELGQPSREKAIPVANSPSHPLQIRGVPSERRSPANVLLFGRLYPCLLCVCCCHNRISGPTRATPKERSNPRLLTLDPADPDFIVVVLRRKRTSFLLFGIRTNAG